MISVHHRRWMELEDKAKVVSLFGGAELVQFFAALAVLPWSYWKKRLNTSYFSKSTEAKQLAWQGIEQVLSPKQTRRPLPCLLIIFFFYAIHVGLQILFVQTNDRIGIQQNNSNPIMPDPLPQHRFKQNQLNLNYRWQ